MHLLLAHGESTPRRSDAGVALILSPEGHGSFQEVGGRRQVHPPCPVCGKHLSAPARPLEPHAAARRGGFLRGGGDDGGRGGRCGRRGEEGAVPVRSVLQGPGVALRPRQAHGAALGRGEGRRLRLLRQAFPLYAEHAGACAHSHRRAAIPLQRLRQELRAALKPRHAPPAAARCQDRAAHEAEFRARRASLPGVRHGGAVRRGVHTGWHDQPTSVQRVCEAVPHCRSAHRARAHTLRSRGRGCGVPLCLLQPRLRVRARPSRACRAV